MFVYVREAHPEGEALRPERYPVPGGGGAGALPLAATLEQRKEGARLAVASLGLTLPVVVDGMDDAINLAYGAWPDRLYLVGVDGTIQFAGAPGPRGFDPAALEASLRALPAAAVDAGAAPSLPPPTGQGKVIPLTPGSHG